MRFKFQLMQSLQVVMGMSYSKPPTSGTIIETCFTSQNHIVLGALGMQWQWFHAQEPPPILAKMSEIFKRFPECLQEASRLVHLKILQHSGNLFKNHLHELPEPPSSHCQKNTSLLTSHQRRNMAGSLRCTHPTHPLVGAERTGCRWGATGSRTGRGAWFPSATQWLLGCCRPWQRLLLPHSGASASLTSPCGCHSPLEEGHARHRGLSALHCQLGSSQVVASDLSWRAAMFCTTESLCYHVMHVQVFELIQHISAYYSIDQYGMLVRIRWHCMHVKVLNAKQCF